MISATEPSNNASRGKGRKGGSQGKGSHGGQKVIGSYMGKGNHPAQQRRVDRVIELMESGMTEHAACKEVGINQTAFKACVLREGVSADYVRALAALARDQVIRLESAIQDMREGRIDAQQARVEIDARKWFASKFLPKQYGDKVQMDVTARTDSMSDEELDRKIAARLGASAALVLGDRAVRALPAPGGES